MVVASNFIYTKRVDALMDKRDNSDKYEITLLVTRGFRVLPERSLPSFVHVPSTFSINDFVWATPVHIPKIGRRLLQPSCEPSSFKQEQPPNRLNDIDMSGKLKQGMNEMYLLGYFPPIEDHLIIIIFISTVVYE